MSTFTKSFLSGSTNGRGILISATDATGANTIHTSSSGSTIDEIWIYGNNTSTSSQKVSILFGGTTDPDDYIEYTLDGQLGIKLLIPGMILGDSLVVKAFSGSGTINLFGYVNNII